MRLLFAVSEAVPFVKTGGLADVAGALPKALQPLGFETAVILPRYAEIIPELRSGMKRKAAFQVRFRGVSRRCSLYETEYEGIRYYLIDQPYYYARGYLYGYEDETERFVFFSLAVMESLPLLGFVPDLIHCHDWQTGLIPLLLAIRRASDREAYARIRTVYTIHNLQYQGSLSGSGLADLFSGIPNSDEQLGTNAVDSCMKAGLLYADKLTAVSRSYAGEIQTEPYGEGLDAILRARSADLTGIVNGIDCGLFDPQTDPALDSPYRSGPCGKRPNKLALQRELGLDETAEKPLIGIVSRLVRHKGFDLIDEVMGPLLREEEVQFAILGSGESRIEAQLRSRASEFPNAAAVRFGYDDRLARRIYAGADMYLMPSRFEPCGISQLIALRYGAVPIVRETGGLKDTVQAYNEYTRVGTGFSFRQYDAGELLHTVRRAISYYRNAADWQRIVANGTRRNVGWLDSAREYASLYRGLAVNGKE